MPKVNIPDQYSPDDVSEALKLLDSARTRKAVWKQRASDPAVKSRMQELYRRRSIETGLLVQKAKAAGLTVSNAEIDTIYARRYGT